MTVVDRGADPVLHLSYMVPLDDLDRTEDEPPDSRTHQFFAFSIPFRTLPNWIGDADLQSAAEFDLIDPAAIPDHDILERSPAWPAGSWDRITADDARVPITLAQAEQGVQWDTTGVDAGTWIVAAYTWEPPTNLWSERWGAVRIVDGTQTAGPSFFLQPFDGAVVRVGQLHVMRACIEFEESASVTAYWAEEVYQGELEWIPFEEGTPVQEAGPHDIRFLPPPEAAGRVLRFRVDVEDAQGRVFTTWSTSTVAVVEAPPEDPGTDGEETTGSDGATGDGDGDPAGGGGGCSVNDPVGASPWLPLVALVVAPVVRRRGRRHN